MQRRIAPSLLALMLGMFSSVAVHATCNATWTSAIHTEGCPNLYKRETWNITWADGNTTQKTNEGWGQCCGIFTTTECWPQFHQPRQLPIWIQGQEHVEWSQTVYDQGCNSFSGCTQAGSPRTVVVTHPCGTIGEEGFGGTAWCDLEVPISCQDGVDNDGDFDIDAASSGCVCPSPIVVDTLGNGFDLTSAADGVLFDIAGIERPLRLAWIQGDDAWLALDRNGNSAIDNGTELFGNYTPQPPTAKPHGFLALAEYDKAENGGNNNGAIDSGDYIFANLRLWRDDNQNGVSEINELHTLSSFEIVKIELDFRESRRTDEHGNRFKYRAKVKDGRGRRVGRWAWDVFLVSTP